MKEATFLSMLSHDLEVDIGGKVVKISDKATLGLPDSMYLNKGFVTYIETKIGDVYKVIDNVVYVKPWDSIKKDLRQFEVCRMMAKNSLVVFIIHYPKVKKTLVLTLNDIKTLQQYPDSTCNSTNSLKEGRGLEKLKIVMGQYQKEMYEKYKSIS